MRLLYISVARTKRTRAWVPFGISNLRHLLIWMIGFLLCFQAIAQTTRLERVFANRELRTCIWPESYSISYRNSKTRQLSGIDIAITQDLARELGV